MLTPIKAIRAKCLDCCCGSVREVSLCPCADCSLHPFRFGKNPNLQRDPTPAQLEALKRGRIPFQSVDELNVSARTEPTEGSYTPNTKNDADVEETV